MLTTMPMTAMRSSNTIEYSAEPPTANEGGDRLPLPRPDEASVPRGAAEGDEFLDGQGDLAGVEAGAAGQLVGVGGLAGQRLEDRGGGGTGRWAWGGGG